MWKTKTRRKLRQTKATAAPLCVMFAVSRNLSAPLWHRLPGRSANKGRPRTRSSGARGPVALASNRRIKPFVGAALGRPSWVGFSPRRLLRAQPNVSSFATPTISARPHPAPALNSPHAAQNVLDQLHCHRPTRRPVVTILVGRWCHDPRAGPKLVDRLPLRGVLAPRQSAINFSIPPADRTLSRRPLAS